MTVLSATAVELEGLKRDCAGYYRAAHGRARYRHWVPALLLTRRGYEGHRGRFLEAVATLPWPSEGNSREPNACTGDRVELSTKGVNGRPCSPGYPPSLWELFYDSLDDGDAEVVRFVHA
jgi:hypothetical protein